MTASEPSGTPRRIVDTNIIIRYLVGDGGDHAARARELFRSASAGGVILVIPEIVFIEAVHVLRGSYYNRERADIAKALRLLLRLPGVETSTPVSILNRSIDNFEAVNASWPDALIAAQAVETGMSEIYSFDGHFDRFAGVTKIVP
jgi:predicted nucleic acid-binding protein